MRPLAWRPPVGVGRGSVEWRGSPDQRGRHRRCVVGGSQGFESAQAQAQLPLQRDADDLPAVRRSPSHPGGDGHLAVRRLELGQALVRNQPRRKLADRPASRGVVESLGIGGLPNIDPRQMPSPQLETAQTRVLGLPAASGRELGVVGVAPAAA